MGMKRKLNEIFEHDGELFKCTDDNCCDCIEGCFPRNIRCDCSECTGQRIEKIQLKEYNMLSFEEVKTRLGYPILDVVLDESQYNLIVKSAKQQAEIYKDKLILELAGETVDLILNQHYNKINSLDRKG